MIESVLPAMEKISTAASLVEEIQSSIRLVALNAEIKTAQLGQHGAGLGVLAGELHRVTGRSDDDSRGFLQSLHDVQSLLEEIKAQQGQSSSSIVLHRDREGMKKEADSLIDSALTASNGLPKILAQLSESASQLRIDLETAAGIAERGGVLIQAFDSLVEKLEHGIGHMECSLDAASSHSGTTASLSMLYSMESERHVHERTFGGGVATPEGAGLPQPEDELGSNVELF